MALTPQQRNRRQYERQLQRKRVRQDKDCRELEQMWGVPVPEWPGRRTYMALSDLYNDGVTKAQLQAPDGKWLILGRPNMGLKTLKIIGKLMHGEKGWPVDQDPMEGYC